MLYSSLFFGKSAWTDMSVHGEVDFKIRYSFAYKHAERLSVQMHSVCLKKCPDGVVSGKFFIDGSTTKYVCHFYKATDYIRRALFVEKYPKLHYWFGCFFPKAELACAVLSWRPHELSGTPCLTISSKKMFDQFEERDLEAILAPLASNDSRFLDEFIFG